MKNMKTAVIAAIAVFCLFGGSAVFYMTAKGFQGTAIGTVNGEPISIDLFKSKLQSESSNTYDYFYRKYGAKDSENFWTTGYHGEIPIEYARKNALNKCIEILVQQKLAKNKGVVEDISYAAFLKDLEKENTRRREAVDKGEIIYGPVRYSEKDYFDYTFSNMVISLKEQLRTNEFALTEDEVKKLYYQKKNSFNFINKKVLKIYIPYVSGSKSSSSGEEKQRMEDALKGIKQQLLPGKDMAGLNGSHKGVKVKEIILDNKFTKQQYLETAGSREAANNLKAGEISDFYEEDGALCMLKVLSSSQAEFPDLEKLEAAIKAEAVDRKYEKLITDLIKSANVQVNEKVYSNIKIR
ncbi:MAG: hypothetical protein K0R50_2319 [Eubacterium sp.]|jgi:hypothetical protein|nr:hypothetical protein [Eubacterium sp.]